MATSRVVRNAQLHHRLIARCTRSGAAHAVQVHVYDVDKNIMGPMCTQKIARKAKLTKLAFNPRHPIIAVGEEKCAALRGNSLSLLPDTTLTTEHLNLVWGRCHTPCTTSSSVGPSYCTMCSVLLQYST
jgi:hypothetical protein